ncbi:hypothetical protein BKA70DRAFT_1024246, partial [Coprinopsis sp. MPI-PUGE-AT-0042]
LAMLTFGIASVAAQATSVDLDPFNIYGKDLSRDNNFGAPVRPWDGGKPAWYFGQYAGKVPHLPSLSGPICQVLRLFPHYIQCPTAPLPNSRVQEGYTQTFFNLTAATQGDVYLTFGLVDSISECKAMCNTIQGCKFVNTYRDVNGKDGSPLLTCSLYTQCYGPEAATNTGGQSQSNGSLNFIINSDGWCK